jgi:hypothetical protein
LGNISGGGTMRRCVVINDPLLAAELVSGEMLKFDYMYLYSTRVEWISSLFWKSNFGEGIKKLTKAYYEDEADKILLEMQTVLEEEISKFLSGPQFKRSFSFIYEVPFINETVKKIAEKWLPDLKEYPYFATDLGAEVITKQGDKYFLCSDIWFEEIEDDEYDEDDEDGE